MEEIIHKTSPFIYFFHSYFCMKASTVIIIVLISILAFQFLPVKEMLLSVLPKISSGASEKYTIEFTVDGTITNIDGVIIKDGVVVTNVKNGSAKINKSLLVPGSYSLNSSRGEKTFGSLNFDITERELSVSGLRLELPDSFEQTSDMIDTLLVARLTFDELNRVRNLEGLSSWRWNDDVSDVSKKYSERLLTEGFHHTGEKGDTPYDRLNERNMFYIVAGENLFSTSFWGKDEENISVDAVDGWLTSPGHRSLVLDRDNLYSDAGVGVTCVRDTCFVVLNVIGIKTEKDFDLRENYCTMRTVYDATYPFTFDVPAEVSITSTSPLNVYLTQDTNAVKNCGRSELYTYTKSFEDVTSIQESLILKKGDSLLIESTSGDASIHYVVDYS